MTPDIPSSRELRRSKRARTFWSLLGIAFVVASLFSLIVGRPALGLAFLVGLAICLAALTRSGRPARRS
ncbi:hypothetical protein ELQ90_07430 [Labedella phragmitis]|uniref:Uncharacterized protein n=1 Tax=Labedella phragmitis TaxID=2498849 RepID=A0A3S4DMP5_9MICO|nr:hypothetical protein [Labedella phragmitis]RWZ51904.1 hypothetical protein ELQ90_07430 [Labedella phragmitis]